MKTTKQLQKEAFAALKAEFSLENVMQAPKVMKVIVGSGVGKMRDPKRAASLVADRLAKITGQKPVARNAKKSIASFKLREGELVGYQVTLRGDVMFSFLDKLVNIALPRMKDFRGIPAGFDDMGNYTLGLREHSIFPETSDEDLRDVFGLGITVVTNVADKKLSKAFLTHLGFPFKKD